MHEMRNNTEQPKSGLACSRSHRIVDGRDQEYGVPPPFNGARDVGAAHGRVKTVRELRSQHPGKCLPFRCEEAYLLGEKIPARHERAD